MKAHDVPGADLTGAKSPRPPAPPGRLSTSVTRQEASAVMIEGGTRILLEKVAKGRSPAPLAWAARTAPTSCARFFARCPISCQRS